MKYLYTYLLALISGGAFAQQRLSLVECRDMALQHNKKNKASVIQIEKAKYDVRTYRAKFFPHISAQGNAFFSQHAAEKTLPEQHLPTFAPGTIIPNGVAYIPEIPIKLDINNNWTVGVAANQPLFMGGKIIAAYRMAKIGEELSRLNQSLTNAEVVYETDNAYWSLLKVEEMATVAKKYEEVVEQLLKDMENAFDVGMKSRNDLLKVKVKLNEAKLNRRRAENAITLARMNLCHIIGVSLLEDIKVADDELDVESSQFNIVSDIVMRPEYKLLSKNLDLKYEEIRLTRADYLPKVGVRIGYNYIDALKLNKTSLVKGGNLTALFSVSIPLFQWGEGLNKVRSKRAEHKIADLQRDDASEKMMLEMTMALNQVDESKLEVEMTSEALGQAEENLKTSSEQFEVGLETLTEHLEAQTMWQRAWAQFIQAKADLHINETHYLKASGQLDANY